MPHNRSCEQADTPSSTNPDGEPEPEKGVADLTAKAARNAARRARYARRRAEETARFAERQLDVRFQTLYKGVREGRRGAWEQFEAFLKEHPEFKSEVPAFDHPCQVAERRMARQLAGKDPLAYEENLKTIEGMRDSELGPNPGTMEIQFASDLAVSRARLTYFQRFTPTSIDADAVVHGRILALARKELEAAIQALRKHQKHMQSRARAASSPTRAFPPDAAAEEHT